MRDGREELIALLEDAANHVGVIALLLDTLARFEFLGLVGGDNDNLRKDIFLVAYRAVHEAYAAALAVRIDGRHEFDDVVKAERVVGHEHDVHPVGEIGALIPVNVQHIDDVLAGGDGFEKLGAGLRITGPQRPALSKTKKPWPRLLTRTSVIAA